MRRRGDDVEGFLERPREWWVEHKPWLNPNGLMELRSFGAGVLARLGALRPDEVARLERIAGGGEDGGWVSAELAARILGQLRDPT